MGFGFDVRVDEIQVAQILNGSHSMTVKGLTPLSGLHQGVRESAPSDNLQATWRDLVFDLLAAAPTRRAIRNHGFGLTACLSRNHVSLPRRHKSPFAKEVRGSPSHR